MPIHVMGHETMATAREKVLKIPHVVQYRDPILDCRTGGNHLKAGLTLLKTKKETQIKLYLTW
jgi:hypothetical protein